MLWQLESSKVKSEAECFSDRNTSEFTIQRYSDQEEFWCRLLLWPKFRAWKLKSNKLLTFPVRILLGNAEVIHSARILDGISVRSPVNRTTDTLSKKLLFQLGFEKKQMTVEFYKNCDWANFFHILEEFFFLWNSAHVQIIQRWAIFRSRILLTFLKKVEK